jgi:isopenicillin-N N-acyltransferase-like protein
MDAGFPHIKYSGSNPTVNGNQHGEQFRSSIKELAQIRRELMLAKNPSLKQSLDELALKQLHHTQKMSSDLHDEILAISKGSNSSRTDIIILNNYTDFRDIQLVDEGCTTLAMVRDDLVSAQTWDMHASAKNYLATLELEDGSQFLTLTGCLGMMGVNKSGLFLGVNNLNTSDATDGVIWPALVRHALLQKDMQAMRSLVENCKVTSGHNYLLGDGSSWCHLEKSPSVCQEASNITSNEQGLIFHTNHCLTKEAQKVQDQISANSTTHDRFNIMEHLKESLVNQAQVITALQSHEGYPKSLCSHFQSGANDPSTTCGGGLYNHKTKEFLTWRGCVHEDNHYLQRSIRMDM